MDRRIIHRMGALCESAADNAYVKPSVAYCRRGRADQYERKVIKCPYCGEGTLTDVDIHTRVVLYRNPMRKKIRCQGYMKCEICKGEVGIILK